MPANIESSGQAVTKTVIGYKYDNYYRKTGKKLSGKESSTKEQPPKLPDVFVRIKVNQIWDHDVIGSSVMVDFTLMLDWMDESIIGIDKPNLFDDHFSPYVEIMNAEAKQESTSANSNRVQQTSTPGHVKRTEKYKIKIKACSNLRLYPFDQQIITIVLKAQSQESRSFKLVGDKDGSSNRQSMQRSPRLQAWHEIENVHAVYLDEWFIKSISGHETAVPPMPRDLFQYNKMSKKGKEKAEAKREDEYIIDMRIERNPVSMLLNLVCPMFICSAISLTSFALVELSGCLEINVTMVLGVVAFQHFTRDKLPALGYITLIDKYINATLFWLMFQEFGHVFSYYFKPFSYFVECLIYLIFVALQGWILAYVEYWLAVCFSSLLIVMGMHILSNTGFMPVLMLLEGVLLCFFVLRIHCIFVADESFGQDWGVLSCLTQPGKRYLSRDTTNMPAKAMFSCSEHVIEKAMKFVQDERVALLLEAAHPEKQGQGQGEASLRDKLLVLACEFGVEGDDGVDKMYRQSLLPRGDYTLEAYTLDGLMQAEICLLGKKFSPFVHRDEVQDEIDDETGSRATTRATASAVSSPALCLSNPTPLTFDTPRFNRTKSTLVQAATAAVPEKVLEHAKQLVTHLQPVAQLLHSRLVLLSPQQVGALQSYIETDYEAIVYCNLPDKLVLSADYAPWTQLTLFEQCEGLSPRAVLFKLFNFNQHTYNEFHQLACGSEFGPPDEGAEERCATPMTTSARFTIDERFFGLLLVLFLHAAAKIGEERLRWRIIDALRRREDV